MKRKSSPIGQGKAVIITGCSSGIGKATAVHLANAGFTVFGTVRRESSIRELDELGLPSLIPIYPVDMTDQEQIEASVGRISDELRERGEHLHAVINNAGGGTPAPVELVLPDTMRTELSARVVGPIVMLQQALPLLREGKGRVLWIVTPAIIPTPYVSSIHACDFAVNCLARTLDIELERWNLPSIMIRCGGVRTPAGLRTVNDVDKLLCSAPLDRVSLYEGAMRTWADEMVEFDYHRVAPLQVAEAVLRALTDPHPRRRYSVGHLAGLASFLEALPQPLADRVLKRRFAAHSIAS